MYIHTLYMYTAHHIIIFAYVHVHEVQLQWWWFTLLPWWLNNGLIQCFVSVDLALWLFVEGCHDNENKCGLPSTHCKSDNALSQNTDQEFPVNNNTICKHAQKQDLQNVLSISCLLFPVIEEVMLWTPEAIHGTTDTHPLQAGTVPGPELVKPVYIYNKSGHKRVAHINMYMYMYRHLQATCLVM